MVKTLKRISIYCKEMYPIIPRLILGFLITGEIYFIVLLNNNITTFDLGISEIVCSFTVFSFLFWLRIADDFKDYELDLRLFPERPLPSGRVYKRDLRILATVLIITTAILNFLFMNNILFFILLYVYGSLMAVWFFQKHKIAKSLPLAILTHNPVQIILNLYIISFAIIKYNLTPFRIYNFMAVLTLYFPALIWEVSRKIRAPEDETEYTTYSKLFGYKKSVYFVLIVTWVDVITNIILLWNLNKVSIILILINALWCSIKFIEFAKNPEKFKLVKKVEIYTYIQESIMMVTVAFYLLFGRIG